MGKVKLAEARLSFEALLKTAQYAEAIGVLESALPEFGDAKGLAEMLELLERIPQAYCLKSASAALLYAKTLRLTGALEPLLNWNAEVAACHSAVDSGPVQVEAAAALNGLRRSGEARVLLEDAIPHLSGETLGIAWARLGFALFNLGEPIDLWRKAYASARPLLAGEELGRALFNLGYCFALAGLHAESQSTYLEALICFRNNPYFQAFTRYNLGMGALRELEPETERHFLEALRITRDPKAAGLRPPVFNGLGAYRRSQGEWDRAETAYREALNLSPSSIERERSYRGLSRTQRLAGHPVEALETLELALREPDLEPQIIHLSRALAFLALGQTKQAKEALEKTGTVTSETNRWLWHIARAEVCRQQGQPEEAVALLEGLPLHTLHAREEVRQWPQLFELVRQAGREVPVPLEYPAQTTVEVQALGLLKVLVNDRPVPMAPLSLTGELLVYLLEHGGQASSEQIIGALWPQHSFGEKRKTLSALVGDLRHILGWPACVQSLRQAYQLDPKVRWVYDVNQARTDKQVKLTFLEGNYKEWVLEVDQGLEVYRVPK